MAEPTVAVVDVGSNSLHLQVVRGGELLCLQRAEVRMGRLVEGRIDGPTVKAASEALAAFHAEARSWGAELQAFGTAALRDATNRDEVLATLPVRVEVLSGEQEARLAYRGAAEALDLRGPSVVFDLGGRSTEVVRGVGPTVFEAFSLPVGHLNLARGTRPDFHLVAHLRGQLIGTAGTALTLARIAAAGRGESPPTRHGLSISRDELRELHPRIGRGESLPGSDPRRADTLYAGAGAVLALLEALDAPGYVTSEAGLREGLVAHCLELAEAC